MASPLRKCQSRKGSIALYAFVVMLFSTIPSSVNSFVAWNDFSACPSTSAMEMKLNSMPNNDANHTNCSDYRLSTSMTRTCGPRRSILQKMFFYATVVVTTSTTAAQGSTSFAYAAPNSNGDDEEMMDKGEKKPLTTKPYASLEALLPAARVKMLIDRAIRISLDIDRTKNTKDSDNEQQTDVRQSQQDQLVVDLEQLLLSPQNFTRTSPLLSAAPKYKPAKQYLDSYKRQREKISLLQKPGAYFVQQGEIDSWKSLKRGERTREGTDEIRAALNVYTTSLTFDANAYTLTAPKDERSRLIRQDELPDVKTVIASDMGMRYLYRNQVLSAMEEARAELKYQQRRRQEQQTSNNLLDVSDLLDLLRDAQNACAQWFGLIDEEDVRDAVNAVKEEVP